MPLSGFVLRIIQTSSNFIFWKSLHRIGILLFYCCLTNCRKLSSLKQHTVISWQFLWVRSVGQEYGSPGSSLHLINLQSGCWPGSCGWQHAVSCDCRTLGDLLLKPAGESLTPGKGLLSFEDFHLINGVGSPRIISLLSNSESTDWDLLQNTFTFTI